MKSKKMFVLVVVLLSVLYEPVFATAPSFQGLGDLGGGKLHSAARDVSADGSVVVGLSDSALSGTISYYYEAFRWTSAGGMVGLGDLPGGEFNSNAYGVSADGAVVVGASYSQLGEPREAFCWTDLNRNGLVDPNEKLDNHPEFGLGALPGSPFCYSHATGVSADGLDVVGSSYSDLGDSYEAFRWTESGGMVGLGDLPGGVFASQAADISADGVFVVGGSSSALGNQAFRWTESGGMVGLGDLPGQRFLSWARGVSADGMVVVGWSESSWGIEAFRWTESGGMVGLGDLPGGVFDSQAADISADGAVVVGEGHSPVGSEAFIWDADNGMQALKEVLENDYGLDLTGWTLREATAISDDGLTIVGFGRNPDGYTEGWIATMPEPSTPPVADADGPYVIYVGDTLTLDANGSTDADDDIVSYLWDLDDDGVFETDAGGQATYDVNYSYLELLGLLINYTYTIHLKVTDSQGQSDVADSTLKIEPKPATVVAVDIKPGSCPNPVNVKSSGVLPVAILGTGDYDVTTIDPTSIAFSFGEISVGAIRSGYEDVAGPFDSNDCNCVEAGPDGLLDLTLKFETQRIVKAIGDVNDGDVLTLELTGVLYDPIPFETPIEGADCILIKGWHKAHNKADINKDGVVDMTDFAIISENWLQSSIVDN